MRIVLTNVPPDARDKVAVPLIEERWIACVNIYPIHSMYHWKGELRHDEEYTLMMKVAADRVEALKKRLLELHPYDLPEFVVLDVDSEASLTEYVDFVRRESVPEAESS